MASDEQKPINLESYGKKRRSKEMLYGMYVHMWMSIKYVYT